MNTLVVNFFAGPGAAKSTLAAHCFAELKWNGINCEIVQEYAKEKVWEENYELLKNQSFIYSHQYQALNRLNNKVQVILCDSPLLLSIIYDSERDPHFAAYVLSKFDSFYNLNFFITRSKPFLQDGRMHNEDQSKVLDKQIKDLLDYKSIKYESVVGKRDNVDYLVDKIMKRINSWSDQ